MREGIGCEGMERGEVGGRGVFGVLNKERYARRAEMGQQMAPAKGNGGRKTTYSG